MLEVSQQFASTHEQKVREFRQNSSKVIGYFCSLVPVELIEAAGFIPYRISGDPSSPVTEADSHLESIMCPYVRSCFDVALKGSLDFLDGIVIPHSCDSIERLYNIWRRKIKPDYSHFITVPHAHESVH